MSRLLSFQDHEVTFSKSSCSIVFGVNGGKKMDTEILQMLIELHKDNYRQGPGGDVESLFAAQIAGLDASLPLKIADIGCGTGASAILLADRLNAQVTAVDFLPEFLDVLNKRAKARGVGEKITTVHASMDSLDFSPEYFDVIWSEGAVYNIGFERGISYWKQFLKPGGMLVVSEITWLTESRLEELQSYWDAEYPEAGTASQNIHILEQHGYRPEGYFILSPQCWIDNYYEPLQSRYEGFIKKHNGSGKASSLLESDRREIDLYRKYSDYYSYGFYIARKNH
jgi:cyclopropane fatty-acyl-phospholipid synthase-like methyltransferase